MEHQQSSHHHTGRHHEEVILQLQRCITACEACASLCLDEDDVTPMAHCIELDRDCSDVCTLAANLLIRASEYSHEFLAFCEKVCRACAEECSKHEHEHCKKCAAECTKCAEACHDHHQGKVILN